MYSLFLPIFLEAVRDAIRMPSGRGVEQTKKESRIKVSPLHPWIDVCESITETMVWKPMYFNPNPDKDNANANAVLLKYQMFAQKKIPPTFCKSLEAGFRYQEPRA